MLRGDLTEELERTAGVDGQHVLASYPGGDTAYDITRIEQRTVDGRPTTVFIMGRNPVMLDRREETDGAA